MISAAPHVAALDGELVGRLAVACGDLVHGFSSPPGSRMRREAHQRAWAVVREIDRSVTAARINRLAPARVLSKAQRAIDRADVMVGALVQE